MTHPNVPVWKVTIAGALLFGCATPAPLATPPGGAAGSAAPAPLTAVDPMKPPPGTAEKSKGLQALEQELGRAMKALGKQSPAPYFIGYEVHDRREVHIGARNGALMPTQQRHNRLLDTDVRVGDYKLDSTHPLKSRDFEFGATTPSASLPLEDDADALRVVAWRETDRRYKTAAERFLQVKTRTAVSSDQEDKSDDFTREPPTRFVEPEARLDVEIGPWEKRIAAMSARFRKLPQILSSQVALSASTHNRWLANSEGSSIQTGRSWVRVSVSASSRADDGMELSRHESFDAATFDGLPTPQEMEKKVDALIADLVALRKAPLAEPYIGPAILEGRAAAVYFHEIFGHRVEGHRQRDDKEGQTFAKKVGEPIMPAFISVYDDPALSRLRTQDLNGFYRFDDEAVPARRATLVERGVMRGFLLGRAPTRGFTRSNGHGRRQEGRAVVARQANLVVQPAVTVTPQTLRQRLLDELKRQGKAYGLRFEDISGGFTNTGRGGPQSFKVLPIMVWRVWADGRPDQLLRGADMVGTPLSSLSRILAASDDYQVFNGFCGAESGFIPVSGVSPSLLVEQVEVERKSKSPDKPPVLPAPLAEAGGAR